MNTLRVKITVEIIESTYDDFRRHQSIVDTIKPTLNILSGDIARQYSEHYDEIVVERKVT